MQAPRFPELHDLVAAIPDPALVVDGQGTIVAANKAASHLFLYPDGSLAGRHLAVLIPAERRAAHATHLAGYAAAPRKRVMGARADLNGLRADGTLVPIEVSLGPWRVEHRMLTLAVVRDLTARRAADARRAQAHRMEALGRLTAGITHDFNNVLAVLLMEAELLEEAIGPDHPAREPVAGIVRAANLGRALTDGLGVLDASKSGARGPRELAAATLRAVALARRLTCPTVAWDVRSDPAAGLVDAEEGAVERLVLNLALNAAQASPPQGTVHVHVEPERTGWARLIVEDAGVGMDPQTARALFEPWFTTRGDQGGSGIGTTVVGDLVQALSGSIDVRTHPGAGTRFVVRLPTRSGGAGGPAPQAADPALRSDPGAMRGQGERVLVVDAMGPVRAATGRVLGQWGYAPVLASNAHEALTTARDEPIDLAVIDVGVDEASAYALGDEIARIRPAARALFVSAGEVPRDRPGLAKPYAMAQLLSALRRLTIR